MSGSGGPGGELLTPATVTLRIPLGSDKHPKHKHTHEPFDVKGAAMHVGLAVVAGVVMRGVAGKMEQLKDSQSPHIQGFLDRAKHQMVWNVAVSTVGGVVTNKLLGHEWQHAVQAGIQAGTAEVGNSFAKTGAAIKFDQTVIPAVANIAQQGFVNIRDNVTLGKHAFEEFTYNLGPVYVDIHPRAAKHSRVQVQVDGLQTVGLAYHIGRHVIGPGGGFDLQSSLKTGTLVFQANERSQKKMDKIEAMAYFMPYFGNSITLGDWKTSLGQLPYADLEVAEFPVYQKDGTTMRWQINTPEQMVNFVNGPMQVHGDVLQQTPAQRQKDAQTYIDMFNRAYGERLYDVSLHHDANQVRKDVSQQQYYNMNVVHEGGHAQNHREMMRITKPLSDQVDHLLHKNGMPQWLTTRGSYAGLPYVAILAMDKVAGNTFYNDKIAERPAYAAQALYTAANGVNRTYTPGEQKLFWDSSKGDVPPQFVQLNAQGKPNVNVNLLPPNNLREGVPEIGAALLQGGLSMDHSSHAVPTAQPTLDSFRTKPSVSLKRP